MADKATYAPPASPPPNYQNPKPTEHRDAGPYYPPGPGSPAPGPYNQMSPYNNENNSGMMRAPDPAYGGYNNYNNYNGPPPQGFYGPGQQGPYYQQGPPPQGMYYQQQPGPMYMQPTQGYYAQDRGMGGGGICAGIMGALACCCCMDMLF